MAQGAGSGGGGVARSRLIPRGHPISWWMDSIPEAASSGMGLMIGIAFGVSAFISSIAAGFVIDTFGYTANYIFLAIPCFLVLIPISFMRETVVTGGATAER